MNGVILIHKEKDFTSFDVVAVVRKLTGQKKVGHTGTLDPNATGVLPVLLGTATKAQDIIPCHDKKYRADFRFGIATDTLDIWGKVMEQQPSDITQEQIEGALGSLRGEIEQLPPMYSAVSVGGKRLYQYAREGKEVERRPRKVTVYSLELISFDEAAQSGTLDIYCSNGTYIRTLIDDLARALGTVGVMTDLVRYEACGYPLDDCMTLDELRQRIDNGDASFLHSVESIFMTYDEVVVSDKQAHRFVNGNPLDIVRTPLRDYAGDKRIFRVKDRQGAFLSLGIIDGDSLKLYKHF
ncbi:tRNA pseudouridine(55) synthase TruB [Ruminococcus sp.]|uniref:tRNA pseudouridine(55) synthase TruB n=1 Tax=Ruminococcus sp. TaxID=41978 RepID=UPI002E80EB57|nr:tRNA pseudouridine(55) synthase TruB [Ruminococcus sp.]MEE3491818.1 tRNA pseudouridine(55) synthase TruB [Ruminococcus sp.]